MTGATAPTILNTDVDVDDDADEELDDVEGLDNQPLLFGMNHNDGPWATSSHRKYEKQAQLHESGWKEVYVIYYTAIWRCVL